MYYLKSLSFHLLCVGILASMPIIGAAMITIDTVFVGDANNIGDTGGRGSVDYNYHIGTMK